MSVFQIYVLTCMPTGKQYVGLTSKSPERRFREHVKETFGTNPKLVRYALRCAIREHGREAFTINVLHADVPTFVEACRLERDEIARLGTFGDGYNMTRGGEGVSRAWTDEQRKARSELYSNGRHPNIGKPRPDMTQRLLTNNPMHRDDVKRKQSIRQTGVAKTDVAKKKISEAIKAKWADGSYDAMDKRKPAHVRAAISATKKGVPRPEYLGDKNPAKRADVRAKMSAAAKRRCARVKAARELV